MIKLKKKYCVEEDNEKQRIVEILKKKKLYLPKEYKKRKSKKYFFDEIIFILKSSSLKPLAVNVFYSFTKIYPPFFEPLKDVLVKSGLKVDYKTYIGSLFMFSSFISLILISVLFGFYFASPFGILTLLSGILLSILLPFLIIGSIGYMYPFYLANERQKNIKNNFPFMLNHLYALSYASLSLDRIFRMLIEMGEYGELNKEIERIIERIDMFGDDTSKAMRYVASTTPSEELKSLLFGMLSIVESGGNLRDYLAETSQYALFNYSLERKKYVETLSTYADIYTAVLIAAPLFLVAVLAVVNIVPDSKILGMEPLSLMKVGTYFIIPIINLLFLTFLSLTQPEI